MFKIFIMLFIFFFGISTPPAFAASQDTLSSKQLFIETAKIISFERIDEELAKIPPLTSPMEEAYENVFRNKGAAIEQGLVEMSKNILMNFCNGSYAVLAFKIYLLKALRDFKQCSLDGSPFSFNSEGQDCKRALLFMHPPIGKDYEIPVTSYSMMCTILDHLDVEKSKPYYDVGNYRSLEFMNQEAQFLQDLYNPSVRDLKKQEKAARR